MQRPTNKQIMLNFIENFEEEHRQKIESNRIVNFQMSNTLPKDLYTRVNKIVDLKELKKSATIPSSELNHYIPEPKEITKRETTEERFNESTLQEILDKELEFVPIDLKIDPPPELRKPVLAPVNWMATFLRSPIKDRVCWPSKIYQFDKKFSKKTMFEQAEQLMDLAAQDFSIWLNELGSENAGGLDKNIIKQLFSIGIEGDSSKALYVEPKAKKAIPREVAETLQCPELSIEHNVKRMLLSDENNRSKDMKRFAFSTALPRKLQTHKAVTDALPPLEPNFPKDMRTKRSLFQGIAHLRSTKMLAEYIKENPDMERPAYLVEKGTFNKKK